MEKNNERSIKRGEIYYYDFGENEGSIQCGLRPVLILQADNFNEHSTTVIIAAITSVNKKRYLPSHVDLGENYGLSKPSMVLLEQIRTINQSELLDYVGFIDDEQTWKQINIGIKKTFGLWFYNNDRKGDVMTLCPKCLRAFRDVPGMTVHRMDSFQKIRENCSYCNIRLGYDYVLFDKRKSH